MSLREMQQFDFDTAFRLKFPGVRGGKCPGNHHFAQFAGGCGLSHFFSRVKSGVGCCGFCGCCQLGLWQDSIKRKLNRHALAPQLGFFSFKTWLQEALRALCESVMLTLSPADSPQQALLAAMGHNTTDFLFYVVKRPLQPHSRLRMPCALRRALAAVPSLQGNCAQQGFHSSGEVGLPPFVHSRRCALC
jgi:hypothetical protein